MITIVGGGPAGAAAALAAVREGAAATIFEKSAFPRHKVCGEFLSPELPEVMETLGVLDEFLERRPSRISRVRLHFKRRTKTWALEEPGYGLSRYALDDLLIRAAILRGARFERATAPVSNPGTATIVAHGRRASAHRGNRLFGFKAHFTGPHDDGVDLVFFGRVYAGISAVENGVVNVCGLAPEPVLRAHEFRPDSLLAASPLFRDRLRELTPCFDWLVTGPVVFQNSFDDRAEKTYAAGDALGFVDPFTGSGVLAAVLTGSLAGAAAARGLPAAVHLRNCRNALGAQYWTAGILRRLIESGWAERLASLASGRALFEWTRPRIRG